MIKNAITKKQKTKRILVVISVLFILPIFINFLKADFGFYSYADNTMENLDQEFLRNSNVYQRDFSGEGYDIFISGDYAFIANGHMFGGLIVIDISDPTNPGAPKYESTDDSAFGIYVSGDYAYMGCADAGLAVVDVSTPSNPVIETYADTDGFSNGLYVSGDYAYVADGSAGLAIIDISTPSTPGTPVYADTDGYAYDVYVSGDYAYVADGSAGLAVIDISTPTSPVIKDYANTDGISMVVYVEGDYAYAADTGSGLAVIDISTPTNPGTPVYADTDGSAYSVYIDGDYAYVADYHKGIAVVDISDPTHPTKISQGSLEKNVYSICIDGTYAFLAGGYKFYAVEISEHIDPPTVDFMDTSGNSEGIVVSGDYAYIADGTSGLAVIDISDPTNPGSPEYSNTVGDAKDVVVSGDYAYVADGAGGLAAIDIENPASPGTVYRRDTSGDSKGIFVSGDFAYIADGGSGLAVIDISDPTNPGAPTYKDDGYDTKAIHVQGDYAYLAAGNGILIIDISNLASSSVYLGLGGNARDICVSGNYAYLITYNHIVIVDITTPTSPTLISNQVIFHTTPEGIFVSGDYAYSSEIFSIDEGLINVWDVSNPSSPSIIESLYLQGSWGGDKAIDSVVSGDYIYIAQSDGGLATSEIRNRIDTKDPRITQFPSDKVIESGYTGESLSWRATDSNPNTYTISNGTDIVAGPIAWSSGSLVTYNIPEGLSVGEYDYTITFTDDHGFYASDSVKLTVQDTENPVITDNPADLKVLLGYTGQLFSWTATDPNPNTYTIELAGSGIVAGPTSWSSGVAVSYNIPSGFSLGEYFYTINFTDDYDHFTTDTVKFTVYEPDDPVITDTPIDLLVGPSYTGLNFSWTATDANPDIYTIALQGGGIVAGPTSWSSGVAVTYDIPDGMKTGEHYFTINFTDDFDNYATDTVKLTIQDAAPQITSAPEDIIVLSGYADQEFSWTATDTEDPDTYTIELAGSGTVAGPISWSSGVAVIYDIPDGLSLGDYFYTINFTDETGNYVTDEVKFTVQEDSDDPVIIDTPEDYGCFTGYTDVCFVWIATDAHPATFTVEHEEQGILAGPTSWTSGVNVSFTIPEGLSVGEHLFTINFTDIAGNFATDTVKLTIQEDNPVEPPSAIPFGSSFLIFMTISIIGLILFQRRRK